MNVYDSFMFPLEKMFLKEARTELIKEARGNILEIGFGTGVNVKYYDHKKIESLNALDLSVDENTVKRYPNISFTQGNVMNLPYPDKSMDTVIATLIFCGVEDISKGLQEIKRVLKDDGIYIFIEHVLPKEKNLSSLFNWFNPMWYKMSSCNLNRETIPIYVENGLEFKILKERAGGIFQFGLAIKSEIS